MDTNNKSVWTPGEGKKLNLIGDPFTVKVRGEDTANGWSFFEATVMPGSVVPEHKHEGFDEAFYILEGELEMQMDGRKVTVTPGYFINVQRGTVHGYQNISSAPAKYLTWTHPSGVEHFYEDIDAHVKVIPDDCERIPSIAEKHQIQLMPPE